jgi:DHA1 family bicyclomycin/chloramphenicol resistance-like MFS transporter
LGPTLSAFFIAFAVGQLFAGPLSDRFGRKWLVTAGLLTLLAGSAICAFADSLSVLIFGRIVQALGACAASVLSRAIARDLFQGSALSKALALTMVASAAAPGFSPLAGGVLGDLLGWRSMFMIVGVGAIFLTVFLWRTVGETHHAHSRTKTSVVAVTGGYARLMFDRRFALPATPVSLVVGSLYTYFAATPALLMGDLGFNAIGLGIFFAATTFFVFAAGFLAPRMSRRLGAGRTALVGLLIAVAGSVLLLTLANSPDLVGVILSLTLFLFGISLASPLAIAIALQPFASKAGLASALLGFQQMAFAAFGSFIASVLPVPAAVSLALVLTVSTVLALLIFLPIGLGKRDGHFQDE